MVKNTFKSKLESFRNFIQDFKGDKIIGMIMLLLIAASLLTISSSTSQLALMTNSTRIAIVKDQIIIILVGILLVFVIYNFIPIKFIKFVSKFSFVLTLFMLLFLMLHLNIGGIIRSSGINQSKRIIYVFGQQMNVFEVAKVAMILYMAWAIDEYHNNRLKLPLNIRIGANNDLKFWIINIKDFWLKTYFFYMPVLVFFILSAGGSLFSAAFIVGLCLIMLFIGDIINIRIALIIGAIIGLLFFGIIETYKATDRRMFSHIGAAIKRFDTNYEKKLLEAKDTKNFKMVLDKVQQPLSAKVAIAEGGLIGKGPGNSTQRYIVPIIYEDYMFAFIIEEYGLLGGIIILMLYCTLLSRGSIITTKCKGIYTKMVVLGIITMITGQALLHIMINTGLFPLSGQTLPLISHGNFAFVIFSIAFGILLKMSTVIKNDINNNLN